MSAKHGSAIYCGYRALGFATNDVPHRLFYSQKHKENYIVTCVGKSFHVYNSSKLGIVLVGNVHDEPISCLAADALHVFTACGKMVHSFFRGRQADHKYVGHLNPVHLMLPFANHLISVDTESIVKIWDIRSEELFVELTFNNATFQIVALLHPNTYVNKILFASKQGAMQLWNVRTTRLVYAFSGWQTGITALEQAPAVDIVAVGLCDGRVMLHNLRIDETIMSFTQDWGPVTTVTFRTDGEPIMITGSPIGHIAIWNLEKRRLQSQIRDAHNGAVSGMSCLPSEPLLVTTSPDNALKVWVFDQSDGGGRLLRERSGHSAPPTKIRFHGSNGQTILSAGDNDIHSISQDSTLRSFSTVHDSFNRSLGRASYHKSESKRVGLKNDQHMMPPITDFASETSHQSDWDNIIASHRSEQIVSTWNYHRFTMGEHKLLHERFSDQRQFRNVTATAVTITSCGNFALIGYSSGHIDVYNMQSGLFRGTYGDPKAHDGVVNGVVVDGLNQVTITGGSDCSLKFWHFKQKSIIGSIKMTSFISKMILHRDSAMLAVAMDDLSVSVVDADTRTIVRNFYGHKAAVTDMAFSPDGRWLITASMDCLVKTWDLPTGRLIDCFLVDLPVTSLAVSPVGDFMVTTHVDDLGIYLWYNTTLYSNTPVRFLPEDYVPTLMDLPSSNAESTSKDLIVDSSKEEDFFSSTFKSPEQISNELVTLSLLPHSRWHSLLHLDVIKQRNKPKQPPKVPKAAPFFLPIVSGLTPKLATAEANDTDSQKQISTESRVNVVPQQSLSSFARLLTNECISGDYIKIIECLKEMGPSAIDAELQALGPQWGGSVDLIKLFLTFLRHIFETNRDFELAQAYLALLLKLHTDIIVQEPYLLNEVQLVQTSQQGAWQRLETLLNQNICLVNYLRSVTL